MIILMAQHRDFSCWGVSFKPLRCTWSYFLLSWKSYCLWASSRGKQKGELQRQKLQAVSSPLDLGEAFPGLCGDFDSTVMLPGRKMLLPAAAIILTWLQTNARMWSWGCFLDLWLWLSHGCCDGSTGERTGRILGAGQRRKSSGESQFS